MGVVCWERGWGLFIRTSNRGKSSACENLPQLRSGRRYVLPGGGSSSAPDTPNLLPGPGWPLLSHWELHLGIIPAALKMRTYSMCHCSQLPQHIAFTLFSSSVGSCWGQWHLFLFIYYKQYSSIEFNYYFFFFSCLLPFVFWKCCSMEKGSHLSRLHLTPSGSKAGRSFKLLLSVKLTTKKSS